MDFLGILIFFVAVVASIAQKAQEGRKEKKASKERLDQRDQRLVKAKQTGTDVRQARPKGSANPAPKAAPGATGSDLIKALFGEESVDSDEGWTAVEPAPRRELRQVKPAQAQRADNSEHVREAALRQREEEEQRRSNHPARAHHPDKHAREHQQRQQMEEQRKRKQVMAERQRRKEEARRHREQAAAQQKQQIQQQRQPRRAIAPVAGSTASYIPRSMDDTRKAIVLMEILGQPKAFDDR